MREAVRKGIAVCLAFIVFVSFLPARAFMSESPAEPVQEPTPEPTIPSGILQSSEIDPSRPMVALTFNDGPSKYTPRILDMLEQYNAHATFFVVGRLVAHRQDTIIRAAELGCEVVGHSWKHRNLRLMSFDKIQSDILNTHAAIEAALGTTSKLYRPPYGAVNAKVVNASEELGFSLIHWSVDTQDWKKKNADAIYRNIMKSVKDRAIILCHDLHKKTANAMNRVIPELIARGYQLVTVSELLAYANIPLQAGKIYRNG